jgi:hypothetical protein
VSRRLRPAAPEILGTGRAPLGVPNPLDPDRVIHDAVALGPVSSL